MNYLEAVRLASLGFIVNRPCWEGSVSSPSQITISAVDDDDDDEICVFREPCRNYPENTNDFTLDDLFADDYVNTFKRIPGWMEDRLNKSLQDRLNSIIPDRNKKVTRRRNEVQGERNGAGVERCCDGVRVSAGVV